MVLLKRDTAKIINCLPRYKPAGLRRAGSRCVGPCTLLCAPRSASAQGAEFFFCKQETYAVF